jgi:hypothetical protein
MKILDIIRGNAAVRTGCGRPVCSSSACPKKQAQPSAAQEEDRSDMGDFHQHSMRTLTAMAAGVKCAGRLPTFVLDC